MATINLFSGLWFLCAMVGWAVTHHDLRQRYECAKAQCFLWAVGPLLGLIGVYAVLGSLADGNGIAKLDSFTFYLNMAFGIVGLYAVFGRPLHDQNFLKHLGLDKFYGRQQQVKTDDAFRSFH